MVRHEDKTKEELLKELQELQQENITLKALYDKDILLRKKAEELAIAHKELAFQFEEKKKREEELIIANEKAEESNRLKTAFLANLSHEIRTPMNGILGFAQLLENPDLTIDEQQQFIDIIKKSGDRMLDTINGLLDITRIETGEMKVSICEININEQIEDIYKFFKPEVEKKGVRFSYITSLKDKDSFIKTDREKINALLTNLVKNAIKYTDKGSIEFGYDIKGNSLEFFVKDTGVGISQEMKTMIFERFRQVDESNSRDYEGLGLGLSIAKSYVEMLGGKIWVESQEGEGSVFYFTIPYVACKEEEVVFKEPIFTDSPDHHIKKLKILIAEDDEISDFLITLMLEIFGHELFHAKDGVEAVELCKTIPDIDMVLMDIKMPKMNGLDSTREIRKFNKDVIIIAQTAYALINDREKVLEAGCNDYITKPLKQDLLISLIKQYFKN